MKVTDMVRYTEKEYFERLIVRCMVKGIIVASGVDYLFRLI